MGRSFFPFVLACAADRLNPYRVLYRSWVRLQRGLLCLGKKRLIGGTVEVSHAAGAIEGMNSHWTTPAFTQTLQNRFEVHGLTSEQLKSWEAWVLFVCLLLFFPFCQQPNLTSCGKLLLNIIPRIRLSESFLKSKQQKRHIVYWLDCSQSSSDDYRLT